MANPFFVGMRNYIDMLNQLWNKIGSSGPPGPQTQILSGHGDPNTQSPAPAASEHDYYIDQDTSIMWQYEFVGSPATLQWIHSTTIPGTGGSGVNAIYDHTQNSATILASDFGGNILIDWTVSSDWLVNVDTEITNVSFTDPPSTGFEFAIPLTLTFRMAGGKIDIDAFDGISNLAERNSGTWGHRTFKFDSDLGVENHALWRLHFIYITELADNSAAYHVDDESFYGKYGVWPSFGSRWQVVRHRHLVIDGAFANQATQVHTSALSNAPTNAGTASIADDIDMLVLDPSGSLTTFTVNLPEGVLDGQIVTIVSTQAISTITISDPSSNTIVGAPAALVANTPIAFRWVELPKNATDGTTVHSWYRYR